MTDFLKRGGSLESSNRDYITGIMTCEHREIKADRCSAVGLMIIDGVLAAAMDSCVLRISLNGVPYQLTWDQVISRLTEGDAIE